MTAEKPLDIIALQAENLRLNDELAQAKSALNRITLTVQHDPLPEGFKVTEPSWWLGECHSFT